MNVQESPRLRLRPVRDDYPAGFTGGLLWNVRWVCAGVTNGRLARRGELPSLRPGVGIECHGSDALGDREGQEA